MAKKKTGRRKKTKKKPDNSLSTNLLKSIVGLFFLVVLVIAAGFLAHQYLPPFKKKPPSMQKEKIEKSVSKPPKFEIFPKEEKPPVKPIPVPPPSLDKTLPKVAIIIDDLGYDSRIAKKFLNLDAVLTFSILPHSPLQRKIAGAAHEKGYETLLHLPMEPFEYPEANPGPGILLVSMSPDDLIYQLEKDLDAVPFIKGVNNHMGSRMTSNSTNMYQIFTILKKRNLFFIDSRTTKHTLGRPSARLLQIPFAERDVFLDHIHDPDAIRHQLQRLVEVARENGEAVGIGHPHKTTYKVLRDELPDLKTKIRFVPASEVVHLVDVASG